MLHLVKFITDILGIGPSFISPLVEDHFLSASGPIPTGSIAFLKGAARVQTAIAMVLACDALGVEVALGNGTGNIITSFHVACVVFLF